MDSTKPRKKRISTVNHKSSTYVKKLIQHFKNLKTQSPTPNEKLTKGDRHDL